MQVDHLVPFDVDAEAGTYLETPGEVRFERLSHPLEPGLDAAGHLRRRCRAHSISLLVAQWCSVSISARPSYPPHRPTAPPPHRPTGAADGIVARQAASTSAARPIKKRKLSV